MTVRTVSRDETVTDTNDAVLGMKLHTHTDIHTNSVTTVCRGVSWGPDLCFLHACGF